MQNALYAVNEDGSVELHVHAQPGAGRTQITGRHGDALKVRVAAPPEHGRANEALAAALADAFGIAPKDVTIVIDHSGSMQGDPMEHAKAAAIGMIRLLDKADRVNVIGFDDDVDPLYRLPKALSEGATRDEAIAFVSNIHEGGGTDIALALRRAIASQEGKGRPHIVVFMTDGQSDVKQSIEAANADNGDIRLFTVGLGSAVNKPFLARLAAIYPEEWPEGGGPPAKDPNRKVVS